MKRREAHTQEKVGQFDLSPLFARFQEHEPGSQGVDLLGWEQANAGLFSPPCVQPLQNGEYEAALI